MAGAARLRCGNPGCGPRLRIASRSWWRIASGVWWRAQDRVALSARDRASGRDPGADLSSWDGHRGICRSWDLPVPGPWRPSSLGPYLSLAGALGLARPGLGCLGPWVLGARLPAHLPASGRMRPSGGQCAAPIAHTGQWWWRRRAPAGRKVSELSNRIKILIAGVVIGLVLLLISPLVGLLGIAAAIAIPAVAYFMLDPSQRRRLREQGP